MTDYDWSKDPKLTLKQKLVWMDSEIVYEEAEGIHTYHQCPHCEKHHTRAGKCSWCLKEERKEMIECSTKK